MATSKKYGIVCLLGILAIVSSQAADISDYLSGIVLGFSTAIVVYGLYKMVTVAKQEKEAVETAE